MAGGPPDPKDGKLLCLACGHRVSGGLASGKGHGFGCPMAHGEKIVLADGYPGGYASDDLVQAYLTADERKAAEDERWNSSSHMS